MTIKSFLRRWNILDPFNIAETKDAEIENALRDHSVAMTRVVSSNEGVRESQSRLRASILYAKKSSESAQREDAVALLVRDMRSSGHHHP